MTRGSLAVAIDCCVELLNGPGDMTAPHSETSQPPLWTPFYGAPFGAAVKRFFTKYATFAGRASRAEFWWVFLFTLIVTALLQALLAATGALGSNGQAENLSNGAIFPVILYTLWGLGTLIPSLALVVRRLHDSNKAGWFIFLGLIPLVGTIILLVFLLLPADPSGERFDRRT